MCEKFFGLPRNIFLLGLTSLFNDFSSEMVFSIFPAFFIAVLHAGAASLGLVDGVAEATSNLFKIYSGSLSDRLGRRKPLVVSGYALSVATRPFYILVSTVGGVLGLRVVDRLGKGLRTAPRDAIISLSSEKNELGRSFGFHRAMDTMGAILGPLVAYLILRTFPLHFNYVFLTAFGVGLLTLLTLVFISDVATQGGAQRVQLLASFKELSSRFKLFLLAVFVLSAGSLPVAVVLLKTASLGLAVADIPLFFAVYSISYAIFSIPAGRLSDHVGARVIIFVGYLVLIGSYAVLNFANGAWTLAIAFLMFGLFPALTDGVQRSLAAKLTSETVRGGGLGWLNASVGFGALLAGIAGGYLWQTFSPTIAFLTAGIVVVFGLALLLVSGSQKG